MSDLFDDINNTNNCVSCDNQNSSNSNFIIIIAIAIIIIIFFLRGNSKNC